MTIILRLILSVVLTVLALGAIQAMHPQLAGNPYALQPSIFALTFAVIAAGVFISPIIKFTPSMTGNSANKVIVDNGKREEGSVKWFNISKGYGFITRLNGEEVFVHFRSIRGDGRRALREGQTVKFSLIHGDKGPQAEDVEIVGG